MELLGLTLTTIGEILIGVTVLYVHHKILEEHKLDKIVFAGIRKEQWGGILGVLLIIFGYIIRLI
ncbi:hypothetical protein HN358_01100 [Candidatus Uhrbacteria bacterium]|jgi:hypothetical protein|nr:hypothetical protein [Candidatus Uhrbacteria bacterium]MBT7717371.1 hypothetical protein [Candidatus Uhrbacteria bacterium]